MFGLFGSDTEDDVKHRKVAKQEKKKKTTHPKARKTRPPKEQERQTSGQTYLIKSTLSGEKEVVYRLDSLVSRVYEQQESLGLSLEVFEKEDDEGTVEYKQ